MSKLDFKLVVVESVANSILANVKAAEIKAASGQQTLDEFFEKFRRKRFISGCPSTQVNTKYL